LNPYDHLQALQKSTLLALGFSSEELIKKNEEAFNASIKSYEDSLKSIEVNESENFELERKKLDEIIRVFRNVTAPTIYENKYHYQLLKLTMSRIKNCLDEENSDSHLQPFKKVEPPLFGTLMSGSIANARTILVPSSNKKLLVFDSGFFDFFNLLAKIVASWIYLEDQNAQSSSSTINNTTKSHLERNAIITGFLDLIKSYLIEGNLSLAKQYWILDVKKHQIVSILRDSMELFVVCHEYAHIANGDLDNDNPSTVNHREVVMQEILYSHNEEYNADKKGLELFLRIKEKEGAIIPLSYSGIDLLLLGDEMIHRGIDILTDGSDYERTVGFIKTEKLKKFSHPPSKVRSSLLRKLMREKFGESVLPPSYEVEEILEKLWSYARPFLFSCYQSKIPLHKHLTIFDK